MDIRPLAGAYMATSGCDGWRDDAYGVGEMPCPGPLRLAGILRNGSVSSVCHRDRFGRALVTRPVLEAPNSVLGISFELRLELAMRLTMTRSLE